MLYIHYIIYGKETTICIIRWVMIRSQYAMVLADHLNLAFLRLGSSLQYLPFDK